jgi:hypothetical protein
MRAGREGSGRFLKKAAQKLFSLVAVPLKPVRIRKRLFAAEHA